MNAKLFAGIPLFSKIGQKERQALFTLFSSRNYPAQQPVFWIGDPGSEFFVVAKGTVTISCPDRAGREITLAHLGPGSMFGEIALLDGGPRTATARATTDVDLLVLDRESFHQFILRYPEAAIHVLTVLGHRQRETVDKLRGVRNLNEVMEEQLTRWQRAANAVAVLTGSHVFLLCHAAGFGSWIAMNLAMGKRAMDPFPFSFLCFWASVEAIFLSLFIMMSQSMQVQKDRVRTELEYQVALKMQVEMMQLHLKLDRALARPDGDSIDLTPHDPELVEAVASQKRM